MKKNTRSPPDSQNFKDLFEFFWVRGLGNELTEHGIPVPWTDETLESALTSVGLEVDKRSIQSWKSGKHKPGRVKIHALARIISDGDSDLQNQWADVFISAVRHRYNPPKVDELKPTLSPQLKPTPLLHIKKNKTRKWIAVGAVVAAILIFGSALGHYIAWNIAQTELPKVEVTNIRFCDEDRFSKERKACLGSVHHFPTGTQMVFVSFQMYGMPQNYPFERRWYRNGQVFLQKDGFYDSAWEDFTWIYNKEGYDDGKYDLRIVVDKTTTTATFTIGSKEIGTFIDPRNK